MNRIVNNFEIVNDFFQNRSCLFCRTKPFAQISFCFISVWPKKPRFRSGGNFCKLADIFMFCFVERNRLPKFRLVLARSKFALSLCLNTNVLYCIVLISSNAVKHLDSA